MSSNTLQKQKNARFDLPRDERLPPISAGPKRSGRGTASRALTEQEIRNAALRRQGLPVKNDDRG